MTVIQQGSRCVYVERANQKPLTREDAVHVGDVFVYRP